ncbi:MAG: rRNA maturation RNase YbeY [Desulfobacteraceae bacterium]|nr:MAG: rRNA maturation RNase YbeY [Desulfobacteraceae bacterium]
MAILIDNRQRRRKTTLKQIRKTAQVLLNALGSPDAELSVVLVDDPGITELNRTYLDREGPTNVIAFPMQEGDFSHIAPDLLGDVVISTDRTAAEAAELGISYRDRFDFLLIHGILHLMGYDHETSEADEKIMEAKTDELFALIKAIEREETNGGTGG